jgi:hypothetical protein
MNDALFDWDDADILHVTEHEVAPEEAEEVILGEPIFRTWRIFWGLHPW